MPETVLAPSTSTSTTTGGDDDHLNVLNSPSSTISSIHSDSSTGKLIKGLSTTKINDEPTTTGDENSTLIIPKKTNINSKKPIKFTVRKVSHEPIKSPLPSPVLQQNNSHNSSSATTSTHKSSTHQQHTRKPSQPGKSGQDQAIIKENEKLRAAEFKYEQYEERISKISKEIEFLLNLLPPYNVEIDYSTRVKINKAIEKLKTKQDEIEKKKYSLGITISRLWRDHEDSDIWIRNFSNQ